MSTHYVHNTFMYVHTYTRTRTRKQDKRDDKLLDATELARVQQERKERLERARLATVARGLKQVGGMRESFEFRL
jgi:hypothetical protein